MQSSLMGRTQGQDTPHRNDMQRTVEPLAGTTSLDQDSHKGPHYLDLYGHILQLEFQLKGRLVSEARPTKLVFSTPGLPLVLATFDQTWDSEEKSALYFLDSFRILIAALSSYEETDLERPVLRLSAPNFCLDAAKDEVCRANDWTLIWKTEVIICYFVPRTLRSSVKFPTRSVYGSH
jgi:hypothetical protein